MSRAEYVAPQRQGERTVTALLALMLVAAAPQPPAFDATPPPPAPDYARASSWAVRGGGPATRPVDVFYIQPTTFRGERWNQDIADDATNAWTDVSVTQRQLSAFAACCRLYQPRYRQASAAAFFAMQGDGGKAYALAYQDVRRAFRVFLAETHGRPFILAGHSQGGLHALQLLEEEIDGKPAQQRLVVAYVLGIGVPIGLFGTALPTLKPCAMPGNTGCVVSWNSFLPNADATGYVARSGERFTSRYGDGPGKALLCVNPLTFAATRPAADAADARGALLGTPSATPPTPTLLPPLLPHAVAARCQGGVLRVTPAAATPALQPLPGGSLHMYDIALFWANLRDDAAARAAAFVRREHRP